MGKVYHKPIKFCSAINVYTGDILGPMGRMEMAKAIGAGTATIKAHMEAGTLVNGQWLIISGKEIPEKWLLTNTGYRTGTWYIATNMKSMEKIIIRKRLELVPLLGVSYVSVCSHLKKMKFPFIYNGYRIEQHPLDEYVTLIRSKPNANPVR